MKTNTYEIMRKEREKSILEIAQKTFFSKGIANTTMKDIASEANISRQTLYAYYKDINEIIVAVESQIIKKLTNQAMKINEEKEIISSLEYIKNYLICILSLVKDYPEELLFISQFDLYFKLNHRDEMLFEGFNALLLGLEERKVILQKIEKAQKEGYIRKDKSSNEIYSTITNITIGAVQRIILLDDRIDITNELKIHNLCENIFDMIMIYISCK